MDSWSLNRTLGPWGSLNFRSAGAASPRIDSGTYENSNRCLPGWIPELWLIAYRRCPPRIGIVQGNPLPFHLSESFFRGRDSGLGAEGYPLHETGRIGVGWRLFPY